MLIKLGFAVLLTDHLIHAEFPDQAPFQPPPNCMSGSFRVPANEVTASDLCAGFKPCPRGSFCSGGTRFPCPAGYFGNETGLFSPSCTASCPAGFYCPQGAVEPVPCTDAGSFCPAKSGAPSKVSQGYYSNPSRSMQAMCPPGSFCQEGVEYLCPAGYYGSSPGLSTMDCSGMCPAGFYCPAGTTAYTRFSCGISPAYYCPQGASRQYATDSGYYAVNSTIALGGGYAAQLPCLPGSFCINGESSPCPAGHFGSKMLETNSSCSGLCSPGYFCPTGSYSSRQQPCGSSEHYCPEGSGAPVKALPGYYTISVPGGTDAFSSLTRSSQAVCEPSSYCINGLRKPCPAGTFGAQSALTSSQCSGWCEAGYFCPTGSSSPTQNPCGNSSVICPIGSGSPRLVQPGYYSVGSVDGSTQYTESICEPGYYCVEGVRQSCAGGLFGSSFGLISMNCSGQCAAGYYCPSGSSSMYEIACGNANYFCPTGSAFPISVLSGYVSVGGNSTTRTGQRIAAIGSYAFLGLENLCPGGYYGATEGLSTVLCSGLCNPGFFCPPGSSSPFMRRCGGDNYFCPKGSAEPLPVYPGYYTADYFTEPCGPGFYRNFSELQINQNVSHISTIPMIQPPASCAPCPSNTFKSQSGDDVKQCRPCPLRAYSDPGSLMCVCDMVLLRSEFSMTLYFNISKGTCEIISVSLMPSIDDKEWDLTAPNSQTRSLQVPCEVGSFCIDGVRRRCPAGYAGEYPMETSPSCDGLCAAGFYCLEGSTSIYANPCGNGTLYCPQGSPYPLLAPPGFYTIGDTPVGPRTSVASCPAGSYCINGEKIPCPAGTYSSSLGASSCDGICSPGYYCPLGSTNATEIACGSPNYYCPPGSATPQPVHGGFYCDYGEVDYVKRVIMDPNRTHCSIELPCEPGYYCSGGLRIPCPPGSFSWRFGVSDVGLCNLCAAGYYCPSTLPPQPGAPSFTLWPGTPQTIAANESLQCGGDNWYCPRGTSYPNFVDGGYYTYGGTNSTRWAQALCPVGFYCSGGILQPCANGRYGNSTGLSISECSGLCPPGFYCPQGTGNPLPCPINHYSASGAWFCSECPGFTTLNITIQCQTSRACCFADEL